MFNAIVYNGAYFNLIKNILNFKRHGDIWSTLLDIL